ncbi:GDSL-type esterase/lipase family protein [Dyadobacter sp. LHD-138]|uniref:GDSL-type esterase/lipase family protein n=1 Tax=Dyadobacter sp. LHD-138 TaxID=3071413 RepID=UPI0027DFFF98|nr:GDSL-type esterase/lipase family protein [Dyadobacter sp. LHD-138]MDQ6477155.1 GDSL-type esterase/lipase family protein [Dyadobacter sp. LHD-138]
MAIFLLTLNRGYGQQISWDSISRPEIYPSRVALMRTFRHTKKDIVFLGNSIIFWTEWNELLRNRHVKNRGIPGDTSYGVLDRLDEVTSGKPAKVFLLIGINDLARNIPADVLLQNFSRIIRRVKSESASTRIYIQTILPTNDSFNKLPNHCNKDALIRKVNSELLKLAQEEHVIFIDLYSHFADQAGKLKKELTWDGVHLTQEGYKKWADILKNEKYL